MRHPDFIIAGATRSGTSTLYTILRQHPDIFMPQKKELQFFYRDKLYNKGLETYKSHFHTSSPNQICGEASPPYFEKGYRLNQNESVIYDNQKDSITRIAQDLPNTKIIITLRNPLQRLRSQFWKNVWQGRETAPNIMTAIQEEKNKTRTPQTNALCWLYRNHYKIHLEHITKHIPPERVHIIIMEDWIKDGLNSLADFLNLKTPLQNASDIPQTNSNRALRHPSLRPLASLTQKTRFINRALSKPVTAPLLTNEEHAILSEIFAPDIAWLETYLRRKLPW